jgi:hypothetical protein
MTLRETFDEAPELYDRVRPGYPKELFDDFAGLAGLEAGSRVLELGCGPARRRSRSRAAATRSSRSSSERA